MEQKRLQHKKISAQGQVSVGIKYAGRLVRVEEYRDGILLRFIVADSLADVRYRNNLHDAVVGSFHELSQALVDKVGADAAKPVLQAEGDKHTIAAAGLSPDGHDVTALAGVVADDAELREDFRDTDEDEPVKDAGDADADADDAADDRARRRAAYRKRAQAPPPSPAKPGDADSPDDAEGDALDALFRTLLS